MSYVYLSDLSQQSFPSLPMTNYEFARMQALKAAGLEHEAAKAQVYTERGPSGNPKVAAGPNDRPVPPSQAATLPVAYAMPVSTSSLGTIATIAKIGLAGAALGGVVFALSRLVGRSQEPEFDASDAPTGMLARNMLARNTACGKCGRDGHNSRTCGARRCGKCGQPGHYKPTCAATGGRACSQCGRPGHYASTCQGVQGRHCGTCGQVGHYASTCSITRTGIDRARIEAGRQREAARAKRAERASSGLCQQCGSSPPLEGLTICQGCKDYFKERAEARRQSVNEDDDMSDDASLALTLYSLNQRR